MVMKTKYKSIIILEPSIINLATLLHVMNEKELIALFRSWLGSRVIKIGRETMDVP
jgi:hypothetical protein